MARTKAILGYGYQLRKGNTASPVVYTAIAEVIDLDEFGVERAIEDVTHTDSPNRYMEFIKKLKEGSQFTVTGNATEDNFSELLADAEDDSDDPNAYELFLPGDLPAYRFNALPLSCKFGTLNPNTGIKFRAGFKVTGPLTEV